MARELHDGVVRPPLAYMVLTLKRWSVMHSRELILIRIIKAFYCQSDWSTADVYSAADFSVQKHELRFQH